MSCRKPQLRAGQLSLGFVFLLLVAGCNILDLAPLATATKTLSEVFETTDSPKIIIETFNGPIDLSQGASDEVVVEVTKHASGFDQASAEASLDKIQVSMVQKGNVIRISAKRDNHFGAGNFGAAVVIAVPAKAQVELRSSNGAIVCEGLQGSTKAVTSNGKIEIIDGQGSIDVASSNGRIEIAAKDAAVDAVTSNGSIQFKGTLAESDHKFHSSNGRIEVVLPDDCEFALDSSTSNSKISCDFELKSEGKSRKTRLKGTVGDHPHRAIHVSTSNGQIRIRKTSAATEDVDE